MVRLWSKRAGTGRALAVAVALLTGLVFVKAWAQLAAGPLWDSYAFLANAASMAGKGIGYEEPWRAPMLSLLTVPLFVVGPLWEGAIQIVDSVLSVSGGVAFFLILRRRFESFPAVLGAVGLVLFPPVWAWIAVGYSDFPSIAFSLWSVYLLVLAAEERPQLYLLALPVLTAAVLTRFSTILLVVPIGVWLFYRMRLFRHGRYVLGGAVLSLLVYLPFGVYYVHRFGDFMYPFLVAFRIAEEQSAVTGFITTEPGMWTAPAAVAGAFIAGPAFFGLGLALRALWSRAGGISSRRSRALGVVLVLAGFVQLFGGLVARQLTLGLLVFSAVALLSNGGRAFYRSEKLILDALFIGWLLALGDWYVHDPIKVPRYVISFAPPLLYICMGGVWMAASWARASRAWDPGLIHVGRYAAYGLVILGLVGTGIVGLVALPDGPDPAALAARHSARLLAEEEPVDAETIVYSDAWPYTSWYLGIDARPMPAFTDPGASLHELEKSGAEYYVTFGGRALEPVFTVLDESSGMRVMRRAHAADATVPRITYLGNSWQNYLESLLGRAVFLDSDTGAQGWEKSAFLDAYGPTELAQSDLVAAYGFRWRDKDDAQMLIEEYVRRGGALVIDASGNFAQSAYQLHDSVLWGVAIQREQVAEGAAVELDSEFARRHPDLLTGEAQPFSRPDGSSWWGATYTALSYVENWQVLAQLGGRPLVAVQSLGEGRIYWIGFNLVWHAFHGESPGEAALVEAVFQDALDRTTERGDLQ